MKDRRLLHQGSPAQIMQPEVLHDIYGIDSRIEDIDDDRIGVYFP